jgi:hypothetical protein
MNWNKNMEGKENLEENKEEESNLIKGLRNMVAPKFPTFEEERYLLDNVGEFVQEARGLVETLLDKGEYEDAMDISEEMLRLSMQISSFKNAIERGKRYI